MPRQPYCLGRIGALLLAYLISSNSEYKLDSWLCQSSSERSLLKLVQSFHIVQGIESVPGFPSYIQEVLVIVIFRALYYINFWIYRQSIEFKQLTIELL